VGNYSELIYRLLLAFTLFVSAGLGAPFPEEVLIVGAGIWTNQASSDFPYLRWLMLPVCIAGILVADMLLYFIGRRYGSKIFEYRWMARFYPPQKRERIERNFEKHGVNILIFGRLLPGIRAPLFLTAGIMRLPFARFILADGIGAILGNSILFFLAWWFGSQVELILGPVEEVGNRLKPVLIVLLLGGLALYLIYHFVRTPVPTGSLDELPPGIKQVAASMESTEIRIKKPDDPPANKNQPPNAKAEPPANNGQPPNANHESSPRVEGLESK
jgi:membrane protein DedA with SNARE-associated domain